MKLCFDKDGGFWDCLTCGFHLYANVPPAPRIRRPETMKAHYSVFDYAGDEAAFQGLRIRGRLLEAKGQQTTPYFDLLCPYAACSHRQLKTRGLHKRLTPYQCKNKHVIYLNLDELAWT
jgi:hypothetical protein